MKTIQEIKEEVAGLYKVLEGKDWHIRNKTWKETCLGGYEGLNAIVDEVAKRYAIEAIKECAKRAKIEGINRGMNIAFIDEQSILSLIDELK